MIANYHAYLIRFWRDNDRQPWRATLVLTQTGEKRSFASVAQLLAFLADQMADEEPVLASAERGLKELKRMPQIESTLTINRKYSCLIEE